MLTPSPVQMTRSTVALQLLPERVVIWMVSPAVMSSLWTLAPQAPERSFVGLAAVVVGVVVLIYLAG